MGLNDKGRLGRQHREALPPVAESRAGGEEVET